MGSYKVKLPEPPKNGTHIDRVVKKPKSGRRERDRSVEEGIPVRNSMNPTRNHPVIPLATVGILMGGDEIHNGEEAVERWMQTREEQFAKSLEQLEGRGV